MAERDRTDADSDIEFDFFDEPQTAEKPAAPPPPPKRGGPPGGPPVRPRTPAGRTPLLRLGLLILGVIALAVVLVFWVQSCREGKKKGAYDDYMQAVGAVVKESDAIGQQLNDVLTTPGVTLDDLATKLGGLAQQQAQVVARAGQLSPPGSLLDEQRSLVEAMQLRESGLTGLKEAFAQIQPATNSDDAGETLAGQANRLIASDVVYEDLFKGRAQTVMREQGITGVAVPDSQFLPSPDLASQDSLSELFKRLTQGATGGVGKHGNQIVSVTVQPDGDTLSTDSETTIIASDRLEIVVLVKNSGDFQETQVQVTLTIQQSGEPIKKSQLIDVIGAGKTKTVEFTEFSNVTLVTPTTLKVAVKPVPNETNTANNTAEYRVVFSLD